MSAEPVIEMVGAGIGMDPEAPPLLSGVTWSVRAGEFWVVTGSHGAGKSLLLETMAGIRPCRGGDVRWFGNRPGVPAEPASGRTRLGERIGLVFDGGGRVFTSQTVAENLCIPLCYHSGCDPEEALQRTAALRSATELEPFARVPAGRLGRAWMQRVALARALALSPEVLLLDNPIAGMDPSHVAWWCAFLSRLSGGHPAAGGKPMTLVLTTDHAALWAGAGRQFAVLKSGSVELPGARSALTPLAA
ncbi:MAG: ATP-binding cassette domain-containing protein [Verrucomicrobiales bacterium]|nr:ATP-binding cassette domain-containing protein [Verrucomicrobiales bacterium]